MAHDKSKPKKEKKKPKPVKTQSVIDKEMPGQKVEKRKKRKRDVKPEVFEYWSFELVE